MNFGTIRIPISDSFITATLSDAGWECDDDNIRSFLNAFNPPEFSSYMPAPWTQVLRSAASEVGGEVTASREQPAADPHMIH